MHNEPRWQEMITTEIECHHAGREDTKGEMLRSQVGFFFNNESFHLLASAHYLCIHTRAQEYSDAGLAEWGLLFARGFLVTIFSTFQGCPFIHLQTQDSSTHHSVLLGA